MALFPESQKKYTDAKHSYGQAAKENYLARQQLLLLDKKIALVLESELMAKLPATHPLALAKAEALTRLETSKKHLNQAREALSVAAEEFTTHGTADLSVGNLPDATPLLLLPVRLQTRFFNIKYIARNVPPELVVDINQIEDNLRQQTWALIREVRGQSLPGNVQAYTLSNHPSPRAQHLIRQLNQRGDLRRWRKVEDGHELLVRIFPDDIFLQSHETALTEKEVAAGKIFWQRMWAAERTLRLHPDDPLGTQIKNNSQLAAWKALRLECLPHRASWTARILRPPDYPDNFPTDLEIIPEKSFPVPELKAESWTLPPQTELLPDQFIVRVYFHQQQAYKEAVGARIPEYVQLGFDPDEPDENAFAEKEQVLDLPKEIKWLTDLAEAEKCGMAVRLTLTNSEHLSGVSRIVVLGVKTSAGATEGADLLTRLFENHRYKPESMAFLPQGTATNNLAGQPAGFSHAGLSDEESFRTEFAGEAGPDPLADGQRLTTALGLDPKALASVYHHNGRDGEQALLLNRALWPGTLGYYLDNLMRPSVTDADIGYVKSFFGNYVTGRGLLPAFRVGKQPYGIVPATAWSAWQTDPAASSEEVRLVSFLKKMDGQWARLIDQVKTMKKVFEITDEQALTKQFRELLAYQASSSRYFRRLVAGEYLLWNINQRAEPPGIEKAGIKTTPNAYQARLEGAEGWNEPVNPRPWILGKFMDDENYKLTDMPPAAGPGAPPLAAKDGNYLGLLLDATLEQLKTESFGEDFGAFVNQRSSRLMFHLARFALLQGWVQAATGMLQKENPAISPLARLDFEMEYMNAGNQPSTDHAALLAASGLTGTFETRKNKWAFFEQVLADGTRVDAKIAEKIREEVITEETVRTLKESREAFKALADLPVEQLERLFSEHIDLCSFRLDAWLQGLALSRLFENRKKAGFEKGIFLGAFGYQENMKPAKERWVEVREIFIPEVVDPRQAGDENVVMPVYNFWNYNAQQIEAITKSGFVYLGSDPETFLVPDAEGKKIVQRPTPGQQTGEGFLLTPSLEHAATAGILRAGYQHHAGSQGPESKTLAVNIDSARTGRAMDMLKAIKAGHSLNEQLGYFLERSMYEVLVLAQYVPNLRQAFPLHIQRNEWDEDQQIGELEKVINLALVTDGLAILNKNQSPIIAPSWEVKLTEIFGGDQNAKIEFEKLVAQANDQFDAVSDLVLAESVFQMVKGSPERAAAALRLINEEASDIILPEVTQIPAETQVFTHRMGFVLPLAANSETAWPAANGAVSIWARLSPAFNQWLADQLPSPEKILVPVIPEDSVPVKVKLSSLGLQPIDFYYLMQKTGGRPQESLLPWVITAAARKLPGVNPQASLEVSFGRDATFGAEELSIREITPLINSIGALLEKSRPMRPADWQALSSATPPPASEAYDNAAFLAAASAFASSSEAAPIPTYLQQLAAARQALEQHLPLSLVTPEAETAFLHLLQTIPQAYFAGIWDATPRSPEECNQMNAQVLVDQAREVMETLQERLSNAGVAHAEITTQAPELPGERLFEMLSKLSYLLVGEEFLVLPQFRLLNPGEITATFNDSVLAKSVEEAGPDEWLQSLALVRDNARHYQMVRNLREIFNAPASARQLKILQLPHGQGASNFWIGGKLPEGYLPPPTVTSLAFELPAGFAADHPLAGILTDDWREKMPLRALTAGVAINYNQPNAEAPQCLLLVVSPQQKGAWEWETILNAVLETMTLAKKRGIDAEILQATWLNQFLPALIMPLDAKNNTPGLDLRIAGPAIRVTGPRPDTGDLDDIFKKS